MEQRIFKEKEEGKNKVDLKDYQDLENKYSFSMNKIGNILDLVQNMVLSDDKKNVLITELCSR